MNQRRNEISYYPEIKNFIELQLTSNFRTQSDKKLHVFWGIGELRTNLLKIIEEHPDLCECAKLFAQNVPPLDLDIFAIVTDGNHFELLILEIKCKSSVGLKEWSQLVGYCLVAGAKYGLLINIDNGASRRLMDILSSKRHLSHIETVVDKKTLCHNLGLMQWDSLTQDFEYCNLGYIKSLSSLSRMMRNEFHL